MMLEAVIGLLVMEVDKVADEVTDMEVDKVTNMTAEYALRRKERLTLGMSPADP